MNTPSFQKNYTISQTSKLLGVSRRTIYRWIDLRKLTLHKDDTGAGIISAEDIDNLKPGAFPKIQRALPPLPTNPSLFSVSQAARMMGISPRTLFRWEHAGLVTSIRTAGGARRYDPEKLQKVMEQRTTYQRLPKTLSKDIPIEPIESFPSPLSPLSPLSPQPPFLTSRWLWAGVSVVGVIVAFAIGLQVLGVQQGNQRSLPSRAMEGLITPIPMDSLPVKPEVSWEQPEPQEVQGKQE